MSDNNDPQAGPFLVNHHADADRERIRQAVQAIIAPSWANAFTYGPRAPKGLIVLSPLDAPLIASLEEVGTFGTPQAEEALESLLDAVPLEPTRRGRQAVSAFSRTILEGEGGGVPFLVMQDLTLCPISPHENLLARKVPV
jgi:hypothetical protein